MKALAFVFLAMVAIGCGSADDSAGVSMPVTGDGDMCSQELPACMVAPGQGPAPYALAYCKTADGNSAMRCNQACIICQDRITKEMLTDCLSLKATATAPAYRCVTDCGQCS